MPKSKKKIEDSFVFELEGKVWMIDTKDGVVTKEELPGNLVLQCLVSCLSHGLKKDEENADQTVSK